MVTCDPRSSLKPSSLHATDCTPGLWKPNDLGVRMLATIDEMVAEGVAVVTDGAVMYSEHASMVATVCYRLGLPLRNFTAHLERSGGAGSTRATCRTSPTPIGRNADAG